MECVMLNRLAVSVRNVFKKFFSCGACINLNKKRSEAP